MNVYKKYNNFNIIKNVKIRLYKSSCSVIENVYKEATNASGVAKNELPNSLRLQC